MEQFIFYQGRTYTHDKFVQDYCGLDNFASKIARLIKNWYEGDLLFRIYSSGSTGQPRLLTFSREQLMDSAGQTISFFNLQENDNLLLCLPPDKIAGFMMIIRALTGGMNLILTEPSSNPLKNISGFPDLDFVAFVPHQLQRVITENPENLKLLKHAKGVIIGGVSINNIQEELFQSLPFPVYETYGMTETLTHIALRKINLQEKEEYFTVLPGVEIKLAKDSCLMIKSRVTLNKWLKTNDIAEILPDKKFIIKGRKDHIINSAGLKINPELVERQIENLISSFFPDTGFFIGGKPHPQYGESVCLFLELKAIEEQLKTKILSSCNELTESICKIHDIFCVPEFERTSNGKIMRKPTILKSVK